MSHDKLQALDGILAEIFREEPLISTNAVPPPITPSSEPSDDEPPVQDPAIEPPKDAGDPVTIAEQARAVLDALSLDTAIRLRWAIRDIKPGEQNYPPIDPSDLAAPLARPRPAKKFKEVRRTALPDDMRRTPPDRGFPLEWPVQAEDESWQNLIAAFVRCERGRVGRYRTPARVLRSMS
jgi:hypothetical protein